MPKKINVLFRKNFNISDEDITEEFDICSKYLTTVEYRSSVEPDSLVIGRFSVLPYYHELELELKTKNCPLINSYDQHLYIADITNYYEDLKEYTPKTYSEWYNIPEGAYIVKGKTNSRKQLWETHMFAQNKKSLMDVLRRIYDDTFISDQGIVVREYIPLKRFDTGINGLPITNEWRFFFYKKYLLTFGYYWTNFLECLSMAVCDDGMIDFASRIASIVCEHANFFVLDIGEKEDGGYILIEVNDGCMSGISGCSPTALYSNLKNLLMQ